MGIVRKILGEETPTKEDLLTIKDNVEEEVAKASEKIKKKEFPKQKKGKKNVEMFVKLEDYDEMISQFRKLDSVISKVEEVERMQTELQEVHDQLTEKLESALTELEEIKEELSNSLDLDE
jgi:predicted  nucleic acid-binding Zn-ribbon protein